MFDDRICPACQVVLPDGSSRCVKCGRTVEQPKTNLPFIDWPTKIYPWLASHLGPVGGGIATFALFLILFVLLVGGGIMLKLSLRRS
jgi:hypothetical protein